MDSDGLVTEARRAWTADLDLRSTRELVGLINDEDASVAAVVASAGDELARLIDAVVERLRGGGRLIYAGAGTSGRIAAMDAEECESTFGLEPGCVVALVTAAHAATAREREEVEDDAAAGAQAARDALIGPRDALVAVSASGRTPYVLGAADVATAAGALTACVVSAPDSPLARVAHHEISIVVGPELLAGSTRLKAGTAQKLVLNTISTVAMIRLGRTYGNLMVDVAATNDKLRGRVRRVVAEATGAPAEAVEQALADADGEARVAILSLLAELPAAESRARLATCGGDLRLALARAARPRAAIHHGSRADA
jgi:N-acetylmuramic acid 6-phosphate etherase